MKKKIILSLALLFLCGAFPLGNAFADSEDPQPPDQGEIIDEPQPQDPDEPEIPEIQDPDEPEIPEIQDPDEPEIPEIGVIGINWNRDLQIRKSKTPNELYIKIAYEDDNGEDACGGECKKTGDGYSYENGVLTLNNFGLKEELIVTYDGKLPLEIKLNGTNNFNLNAALSCEPVTLSGNGTMNGNVFSNMPVEFGCSPDIENNGVTINSNKISDEYGSIILNSGKINVNGTVSAQRIEVNDGTFNVNSETVGIEIVNRTGFSPSEEPGLTVNGGNVSIVAKENVILERYNDTGKYDSEKEEWYSILAKDNSEKLYNSLISLGTGVGVKETDITIQRYKMLNGSMVGPVGGVSDEPYTYYSSLSYGDYQITKGGASIRDAVKVLHIGKDFKNKISKNNKIGVIDTLKNVKIKYGFGYAPDIEELELEKIKIDGTVVAPSKYSVSKDDGYMHSVTGPLYSSLDIEIPPKTLFELGAGEHTILFCFKEPGMKEYIYETGEWGYKKEIEYKFEITESFKNYEYLLTYIDNPILEGEDETIVIGEDELYRIRFDRNIQLFDGFTIDGKEVPEKYYEIKSGSTIVEIKPEFLNTLALGKHEISARFLAEDDPLSTEFTVIAASEKEPEKKEKEEKEEKTTDIPDTGFSSKDDSFAISTIIVSIIGSLLISAIIVLRRKFHKKLDYYL